MGCVGSTAVIEPSCRRLQVKSVYRQAFKPPQLTVSTLSTSCLPQHEFLSNFERILVRQSWTRLSRDPVTNGVRVFLRIFELAPSIGLAFQTTIDGVSTRPVAQLVNDQLFRHHATRFMRAVDAVMNNLDALDVIVVPNLVRLGRFHAASVSHFDTVYLDVFVRAMLEVWASVLGPTCFTTDISNAWTKIFRLIGFCVRKGYQEFMAEAMTVRVPAAVPSNETILSAAALLP